MNGQLESCDLPLADLAQMFFTDAETPWRDRLNPSLLDYSIPSLDHVNAYLDFARQQNNVASVWNIICLRAGAYVGEVIRRNGQPDRWNWLDYNNACKANPRIGAQPMSIGDCAVLWMGGESYCFPLAKVAKYLTNGSEDNTRFFAEVIIATWNEAQRT